MELWDLGYEGINQAIGLGTIAAGVGIGKALLGGGDKKKKQASPLFKSLSAVRERRLQERDALVKLQQANTAGPGEVEAAVGALRRKLQKARGSIT
jgi:hypothetical protein